jgi:hypothetical protein
LLCLLLVGAPRSTSGAALSYLSVAPGAAPGPCCSTSKSGCSTPGEVQSTCHE